MKLFVRAQGVEARVNAQPEQVRVAQLESLPEPAESLAPFAETRVDEGQAVGRDVAPRLQPPKLFEWEVVNDPLLAVVCFYDRARAEGAGADYLEAVAERVRDSGAAWLSTTLVAGRAGLRACVTNYRTEKSDVEALDEALVQARRDLTV